MKRLRAAPMGRAYRDPQDSPGRRWIADVGAFDRVVGLLRPGDAILVPERNFTRAEVAQIVIAVAGLVISGVAITIAATR